MSRKNFKISPHLSYHEVIKSETALRQGINNEPTDEHLDNIQRIATLIFEPLREIVSSERGVSTPLRLTSCYRSPALNKAIGGSATSDHCFGRAMDIDIDGMYNKDDLINADLFYIIEEELAFDQLIWEFGDDDNPSWVHVGYRSRSENRAQILRAKSKNKRTVYEPF